MRNRTVLKFLVLLLSLFTALDSYAQNKSAAKTAEIRNALNLWNVAAKKADLKEFMNLFDSSPDILLVGSADEEIFKGKEQISQWLSMLFEHNSFEWDMRQIQIDHNQKTAWVFMKGNMLVTSDQGEKNEIPYRFSGVMVQRKGEWKWRLFHGSIPQSE